MLPLDDPRWAALNHRNWSDGQAGAPDAPFIPDELRYLLDHPTDRERFSDMWPYLCSEDTAWPASYAAVPYLVTIARSLPLAERDDYLYVVGFVAMCSGELGSTTRGLPDDIVDAYRQALPEALTLLAEVLGAVKHDQTDTRYLLAAIAALKGHGDYAEILNRLDVHEECQSCGEPMLELPG